VAAPMIQRRIVISAGLLVMAFALIGIRLVDVMVLKGRVTGVAEIADKPLPARADLLDRNGQLLARDLPVADLYAQPAAFEDRGEAASELARATAMNEGRLALEFNGKHKYALVARRLTPDVQDRVMQLGLPGLEFDPAEKRYYPEGFAAVQVLGATDPDGNGVAGLELGLDRTLKGASSGVQLSLDMRDTIRALARDRRGAKEIRCEGGRRHRARRSHGRNPRHGLAAGFGSDPSALEGVDPRRNRMAAGRL
jgi:cell division protein FtsI (penicillin-binding protein 3)